MTDDIPFADWYKEAAPIPVMHPSPHVSEQLYFTGGEDDFLKREIKNHRTEEVTTETWKMVDSEKDEIEYDDA